MELGEVIRKYRKSKNMTQDEMAGRLGVTAPAVNKWENGNSMPDITLLAPIARLFGISIDTLLSFKENLTDSEINDIVKTVDEKLRTEAFEDVFLWSKKQIEEYPDCDKLALYLASVLDTNLLMKQKKQNNEYENYIKRTYERLVNSTDEYIRTTAADLLYSLCMRNEDYEQAQEYLKYFSTQNPEKKEKQAWLYEKTGYIQEAYKTYEELLLSTYQILNTTLSGILMIHLKENELEKAKYIVVKLKELARLFEMGEYSEYSCELELMQLMKNIEGTLNCVKHMLLGTDDMCPYINSPLYEHMIFKPVSDEFVKEIKKNLTELINDKESFSYMEECAEWNKLLI